MKKIFIVLIGLTPLLLGNLMEYLMVEHDMYGFIQRVFSLIFYLYWFGFGYFTGSFTNSEEKGILLGNSFGIFLIALIIRQRILVGNIPYGYFGNLPDMYFLPSMGIMGRLEPIMIIRNYSDFQYVGFAFMFIVFSLAFKIARKRKAITI